MAPSASVHAAAVPGPEHAASRRSWPARSASSARTQPGATGVYYPVPVHRQPAYEPYSASRCPNSEQASDDMLSIPVHHSLSDAEVETLAQAVAAL